MLKSSLFALLLLCGYVEAQISFLGDGEAQQVQVLHNEFRSAGLRSFKATVERQALAFPNFFLQGSGDEKRIALSFDDGPDNKYTPQILDILAEYEVKASFFALGWRLEHYPQTARRIVSEGHLLAGHSMNHPDLRDYSAETAYLEEIAPTQDLILSLGGQADYFRPPYGALTDEEILYLADKGIKVVNWSIDSLDWNRDSSSEQILANVLNYAHAGGIVLMHSIPVGGPKSLAVLARVIEALRVEGYEFVRVDVLVEDLVEGVLEPPRPISLNIPF
ncbi:MAG: polysaccharide deacetylase family protein [Deinococcales bacterium]